MNTTAKSELFRRLPSVDELLREEAVASLIVSYGRASVLEAARIALDILRAQIGSGSLEVNGFDAAITALPSVLEKRIARTMQPSLRPVINATGVIIHTNLGRAPLARAAVERIAEVATGYSNLEFDLEKGERGKRDVHAQNLFQQLLARNGAPNTATVVVNNNAAAVLLALSALAEGGEVIVSRGELVEIGGSFRIPDIMSRSGATLREIGTTNRTRIGDYEKAISERTKLLLRVHRSNFEIVGFTEQPALAELVELGKRRGIPVMEDLGSGALVDLDEYGIADEPNVYASLRTGVSLVTYSGDKLLGGPQAGIASGDPTLVARLRSHPLFRALRVDKMTYAALEATLGAYLREEFDSLPLLHVLRASAESVRARCEKVAEKLQVLAGLSVEIVEVRSVIGGGAAPGKTLPSFAVSIAADGVNATELALRLRKWKKPVVGRVEDGRVLL
ncbi:MAG TPA: L-seryl-tRNA(Sec) selenium transferase, partial [candidate division Zixibacteria bacterium]|nr:L-seryl-tRNA(Sec) selenium transferase [candidate division Zixibacteria bacterium]